MDYRLSTLITGWHFLLYTNSSVKDCVTSLAAVGLGSETWGFPFQKTIVTVQLPGVLIRDSRDMSNPKCRLVVFSFHNSNSGSYSKVNSDSNLAESREGSVTISNLGLTAIPQIHLYHQTLYSFHYEV